jgi:hypothetical protein
MFSVTGVALSLYLADVKARFKNISMFLFGWLSKSAASSYMKEDRL